jgi:hypothetical protein
MPDLKLSVEGAEVVQYAAAPLLSFKASIENAPADQTIHTVALRAQIQIEVTRRKYDAVEQARLQDLFDKPERWGQTLRNMVWAHASVIVPRFTGSTVTDIPVPCTFDFNVAATTGQCSIKAWMKRCKWRRFPGTRRRDSGCRWQRGRN